MDFSKLVNSDGTEVSRRVFVDEAVYQRELDTVFANNWLYLCHESEIPASGDFITTYMGETPVIVARTEAGDVKASINSCTHKGLPVCRSDSGNAKRFVCPYHSWSYDVEGNLVGLPQDRQFKNSTDKSKLGLKPVPRVESYRGLYFGCFNESVESLEFYLGDMTFYLDTYFNRFEGGVEVIGPPHKWVLEANWKVPAENQLSDVTHGPALHNALLANSEAVSEIDDYGFNCVPKAGHGACLRLMPEDSSWDKVAWGIEGFASLSGSQDLMDFLESQQDQVSERIGDTASRIKGLTYGVYPNLSFLVANSTLRISHPRGPNKVEYWSWWVVPKSAPDDVKRLLRNNYINLFGPGGMLEQEDSEAWSQQLKGCQIRGMENKPLYYGLGLGEEFQHSELPGEVGSCYNEHVMRSFYQRWMKEVSETLIAVGGSENG